MRFKPTLHIVRMSCILVVLLSLGCKEKATQNTGNKQEIPPSATDTAKKNPEDPNKKTTDENTKKSETPTAFLKEEKSPTLIFGSNPTYMKVEKSDEGYDCKFVEDASLSDPGLVDQKFKLNSSDGVQFSSDPKANGYGLYFAKLPIHTKINICGTTECKLKDVNQLDMMVVRSSAAQFTDLHKNAKAFDAEKSTEKSWNVYFFDENLKNFQSEKSAKVSFDADKKVGVIDWNGVLDKTGIVPLSEDKNLTFTTVDLEKPVLVGKYKSEDGKTYSLLGIGQLHFEN